MSAGSRRVAGLWSGLVVFASLVIAREPLRVATWNVTNYSGGRTAEFQTAIYGAYAGRSMSPDVLIGQEFLSQYGVDAFLTILNTAPGSPGDWAAAPFINGPDTDNALFYRTARVSLATDLSPTGVTIVSYGGYAPQPPRHTIRYDLRVAEGTTRETRLALYSIHMKAGSGSDDQARRLVEAQRIRDDAAGLPLDWHFLVAGDMNIQSSNQAAYQELITVIGGTAGRFFDPISTPGSWNNNGSYRFVHTQDPSGAGGMDDRHDQILVSGSLIDSVELDYIGKPWIPYSTTTWNDTNHSYRAWGNDGTTYNSSLRISGNAMVGNVIAQALVDSAGGGGHLPVFLDLRVPPCEFDFACDGQIDSGDFLSFVPAMSGPTGGAGFVPPPPADAETADNDLDGDIDMGDLAAFQHAFQG